MTLEATQLSTYIIKTGKRNPQAFHLEETAYHMPFHEKGKLGIGK